MKSIILICAIALAGCCETIPKRAPWPSVVAELKVDCLPLEQVKDPVLLSEFTKTVVANYGEYHTCAAKVAAWNKWYEEQRTIYDHKR